MSAIQHLCLTILEENSKGKLRYLKCDSEVQCMCIQRFQFDDGILSKVTDLGKVLNANLTRAHAFCEKKKKRRGRFLYNDVDARQRNVDADKSEQSLPRLFDYESVQPVHISQKLEQSGQHGYIRTSLEETAIVRRSGGLFLALLDYICVYLSHTQDT